MNETYPALDASADTAPHDEWCVKYLEKMPADLREKGCFCQIFATIRADECMAVERIFAEAPDIAAAKKAMTPRILQHLMVALLPRDKR